MSVDPKTLLSQGLFLADRSLDLTTSREEQEAFARNSVSTSYYAVYHQALRWAEARGFVRPAGRSSHKSLWEFWRSDPETAHIADLGKSLHYRRVEADYRLSRDFNYSPFDIHEEAGEGFDFIQNDIERVRKLSPSALKRAKVGIESSKGPGHKKRKGPKRPHGSS